MQETRTVNLSLPLDFIGFVTFIVFLILKVTGNWPEISWFWVFFPLWIPIAFGFALWLLVVLLTWIISRC